MSGARAPVRVRAGNGVFDGRASSAIYTFPYTTLFRSQMGYLPGYGYMGADGMPVQAGGVGGISSGVVVLGVGDRKSTRLNSSHGYISYAVFCLKKKI